jgi:hypothetical protein
MLKMTNLKTPRNSMSQIDFFQSLKEINSELTRVEKFWKGREQAVFGRIH